MAKVSIAVPVYNVEDYIYDMLRSVESQTFKDYEVIIVDDGSTDRSPNIAMRFAEKDGRFKYYRQENGGVASARNEAISLACGEYIVFYDPDDYIPCDALQRLCEVASKEKPDMVVGVMEEKNLGESLLYQHSVKLAKQRNIEPTDEHFIGAWSLCHKMFSLDLIKRNKIQFEALKNAEDGVFTYRVLNCASKVCGCNVVAYNYFKRPFWLTASATQTISRHYLESLLASHDRIREEAEKLCDKHLDANGKAEYLSKLYYRFIEGEMINGYYRGIWRAEDDLTERLTERTNLYRAYLTDAQWDKLVRTHKDILFEKGFMTAEEMAKIPAVSIFIDGKFTDGQLDRILGGLYNQAFPRFEVLVKPADYERLEEVFKKKPNLRILEGCDGNEAQKERVEIALEKAKGDYFAIFDEYAVYTKFSLKRMMDKLMKTPELDYASMVMKGDDATDYAPIKAMSAAFGYTKRSRVSDNQLSEIDNILSNKVFRKTSLERVLADVADASADGRSSVAVIEITRMLEGYRMRKGAMVTTLDSEFFLKRCDKKPSRLNVALHNGVNLTIDKEIQALKRHITREDIDKVKELLKSK